MRKLESQWSEVLDKAHQECLGRRGVPAFVFRVSEMDRWHERMIDCAAPYPGDLWYHSALTLP